MEVDDFQEKYDRGWLKSYRSTMHKGWYKKSEYFHLWHHLLYKANHKGIEFMFAGKNVKLIPGQFVTGRKVLAEETGINESKIERILLFFEKNEQQIEQQKTNKNRIITILNWHKYQNNEQQIEQQLNNKRTTTEQQLNTNNNDNNIKKEKNIIIDKVSKLISSEYYDKEIIYFYNSIIGYFEEKLRPDTPQKAEKWLKDIQLLTKNDKYSFEKIEQIVKQFRQDDFWKGNFMSLLKLRKKNKEDIMYIDYFNARLKKQPEQNTQKKIILGGERRLY